MAVNPTAHSLACLRIGVFVTADAARLATGVGGSPFTARVSHPLDGEQSFMTSPHRHSPLTSLAWSHRAPTPRFAAKEKRRIVLEGLRGEERLAGVVAERGGNPKVYDRWRTACAEAGKP